MNKILFVDDDRNVLDGIRRSLWPQRTEWDLRFANSGAEAIINIETEHFDVIVSDMHMPAMDGAELLMYVQKRRPNVVRVILSGHSTASAILKAVEHTHQFLSKPCDVESLLSVMAHAMETVGSLADQTIRDTCSRVNFLARSAASADRIRLILSDRAADVEPMRAFVCQDAGLAAKVLQLVNSGFFGVARRSCGIREAVALIGGDILRSVMLSSQATVVGPAANAAMEAIEARSRQVALTCQSMAERTQAGTSAVDMCYTAGLVHAIGESALLRDADTSAPVPRPSISVGCDRAASDNCDEVFAGASAYLLKLWGIPDEIGNVIVGAISPDCDLSDSPWEYDPNFILYTAIRAYENGGYE
jgi:HD-like signal output (HDOD) protein/CheY-like chemotaxis protein